MPFPAIMAALGAVGGALPGVASAVAPTVASATGPVAGAVPKLGAGKPPADISKIAKPPEPLPQPQPLPPEPPTVNQGDMTMPEARLDAAQEATRWGNVQKKFGDWSTARQERQAAETPEQRSRKAMAKAQSDKLLAQSKEEQPVEFGLANLKRGMNY